MRCSVAFFTFHPESFKPWGPNSIHQGISGSEEAIIYMSDELARLGYEVTVFNNVLANPDNPHTVKNPRYLSLNNLKGKFDIGIIWRIPEIISHVYPFCEKIFFWPHDTCSHTISASLIEKIDNVLWLSQWQRNQWISFNPGFVRFFQIFGNGLLPEQFPECVQRENPYSCIYGSNYARGLKVLLSFWPEIKKDFPQATLDIYYGWENWGLLSKSEEIELKNTVKLLKDYGVEEHGKIGHLQLAKAYAKSSLWTYPCTQAETFCITAIKAQASGCIPVIITGSALPEVTYSGFISTNAQHYFLTLKQALQKAPNISVAERNLLREKILTVFSWERVAKSWQMIF